VRNSNIPQSKLSATPPISCGEKHGPESSASERSRLSQVSCQLRFQIYCIYICRYAYVRIIARAVVTVSIQTHANNCSLETSVYRRLLVILTFFSSFNFLWRAKTLRSILKSCTVKKAKGLDWNRQDIDKTRNENEEKKVKAGKEKRKREIE